MLQNAYLLAKIRADTAENEQHFAEILPIGRRASDRLPAEDRRLGVAELQPRLEALQQVAPTSAKVLTQRRSGKYENGKQENTRMYLTQCISPFFFELLPKIRQKLFES